MPRRLARRLVLAALACALLLPGAAMAEETSNEETSSEIRSITGRDPFAFETAEDMYKIAPAAPFDMKAEDLVAQVGSAVADGAILEDEDVWAVLIALNPYRKTSEILSTRRDWVIDVQRTIEKEGASEDALDPKKTEAEFLAANELYSAGEFEEASAAYRKLLRKSPRRLDARNNLALAEMHRGNDLAAMVALELNLELDPEYTASMVNIAVVTERLGQRPSAVIMAGEARKLHPGSAPAIFNDQWYQLFEQGDSDDIEAEPVNAETGDGLAYKALDPKFAKLAEIAGAETDTGFWRRGIYGLLRGTGWWKWPLRILVIVCFALGALFIAAGSSAFGKKGSLFVFLGVGGFWYLLTWGTLGFTWWAVVYAAVFGAFAINMAD